MKFQTTIVLDFKASSIAEAGERLNELLEHAQRVGEMEVAHVQLGTPARGEAVVLPTPMSQPGPIPSSPTPPRYYPSAAGGGSDGR